MVYYKHIYEINLVIILLTLNMYLIIFMFCDKKCHTTDHMKGMPRMFCLNITLEDLYPKRIVSRTSLVDAIY